MFFLDFPFGIPVYRRDKALCPNVVFYVHSFSFNQNTLRDIRLYKQSSDTPQPLGLPT